MFKVLAIVFSIFFSSAAFAGGQFTITNSFFGKKFQHAPMLGMAIDQKIGGKFHFTGWAGLGSRPDETDIKHWGSMKLGVDYRDRMLVVGLGVLSNVQVDDWLTLSALNGQPVEDGMYIKLGYKLW